MSGLSTCKFALNVSIQGACLLVLPSIEEFRSLNSSSIPGSGVMRRPEIHGRSSANTAGVPARRRTRDTTPKWPPANERQKRVSEAMKQLAHGFFDSPLGGRHIPRLDRVKVKFLSVGWAKGEAKGALHFSAPGFRFPEVTRFFMLLAGCAGKCAGAQQA